MRQIKFRAWYKGDPFPLDENELEPYEKPRMIYDIQNTYEGNGMADEVKGTGYMGSFGSFIADEEYVVEQFTGLHDRNGAEVYEGDIVNCSSGCPHEVIWLEEYGGTYVGGMPAWYLSGIKEGYAWNGSEEVIGNIHENPELLET